MMLIFLLFILFAIWGFMYFVDNSKPAPSKYEPLSKEDPDRQVLGDMLSDRISRAEALFFMEKGREITKNELIRAIRDKDVEEYAKACHLNDNDLDEFIERRIKDCTYIR